MNWLFDPLIQNAELCRWVVSAVTCVLGLSLLGWVLKEGGCSSIREWLSSLDAGRTEQTKKTIASLFDRLRTQSDQTSIDELLVALDEWMALTDKTRSRFRSLAAARWIWWSIWVAFIAFWAAQLWSRSLGLAHAFTVLLWAVLEVILVLRIAPLINLVLEHGSPSKRVNRNTGAL